jgi:ATP-dependent Lon protease
MEEKKYLGTGKRFLLPLIPLRDVVVFPRMTIPLLIGREKSIKAVEESLKLGKNLFLLAQKDAQINDPKPEDLFRVGTFAIISNVLRLPDTTLKVFVEGKKRGYVHRIIDMQTHIMVEAEELVEINPNDQETEALMRAVLHTFEKYTKLNPKIPPEVLVSVSGISNPSTLSDVIIAQMTVKFADRQAVLEEQNVNKRLEMILKLLQGEIEILEIEERIRQRVKKQMERAQKEYYLTEQMKAIQKELGEKDEYKQEIEELEAALKKKKMPKKVKERVEREIKKLKMMSPLSAEATVSRNYIDWLLSIPWNERTKEKLDINEAKRVLDEDHYGLEKVKERILEFLAVRALAKKEMKAPVLCFVGPPGTGKTSLAKSIARATGRRFVRISLGGIRDEAEIRGHRRTYIGALPGKIIQGMRKAGTRNPVFLMDEIDKIGTDYRGDPAAALLEVLDPEQNHAFNDHYIEIDYDLSDVLFITTANVTYTISPPLLDRMEIIRLPGYTEDEKLEIAIRHLVPKQLKATGLTEEEVSFTRPAILKIIREYTKEAGVRNLEREIGNILRKIAKEKVKKGIKKRIIIKESSVEKYLGVPKYRHTKPEEVDKIGIANGLAWTEAGGEILVTEVSVIPGKGKLIMTGKLGEVMQESAQAAVTYIRSRASELGLEEDFYSKVDIHIHVPEGAIPKDGPSAGITMAVALASALTKIPVRHDIAMTGEITLRGRILPIGGLKEKLLAAHRGGIKTVIIPLENEKDLSEIEKKIIEPLDIKLVSHMDEVLELSLKAPPEEIWKGRTKLPSQMPIEKKDLQIEIQTPTS